MQKNFVRKPLETVKMYRCQHCGGSLKFGPDDIIYTCPYCSYTAIIDGLTIKDHHYCPSITPEAAQERVREFLHARARVQKGSMGLDKLAKHAHEFVEEGSPESVLHVVSLHAEKGYIPSDLAEKADIVESKVVYVPFWRVPIEAETEYRGQIVLEAKTKYRGQNVLETKEKPRKRYIPKGNKISDRKDIYVLARRFASFYGLEELNERLGKLIVSWQTVSLTQAKKERKAFLNAEISEEEAGITAKNSLEDMHRSRAEKCLGDTYLKHYGKVKATELLDCSTNVKTKRATYLHVPLFIVRYRYKDKLYKVALDGTDGIVLRAELPTTLHGRLRHLVLAFFSVIGAGIAGEIGFWLVLLGLREGEDLEGVLAAGGFFGLLTLGLLYAAFSLFKKFFQVQREYQRRSKN